MPRHVVHRTPGTTAKSRRKRKPIPKKWELGPLKGLRKKLTKHPSSKSMMGRVARGR